MTHRPNSFHELWPEDISTDSLRYGSHFVRPFLLSENRFPVDHVFDLARRYKGLFACSF